MIPRYKS